MCALHPINCHLTREIAHRYELLMKAFGGEGYAVETAAQLAKTCQSAFAARRPALINVRLNPMAGVESGRAHDFNAAGAQAKL